MKLTLKPCLRNKKIIKKAKNKILHVMLHFHHLSNTGWKANFPIRLIESNYNFINKKKLLEYIFLLYIFYLWACILFYL